MHVTFDFRFYTVALTYFFGEVFCHPYQRMKRTGFNYRCLIVAFTAFTAFTAFKPRQEDAFTRISGGSFYIPLSHSCILHFISRFPFPDSRARQVFSTDVLEWR